MSNPETELDQKLLGAGRSGQVFLVRTPAGDIARKIFFGDTVTNLIHYLFFGAPNPYIWNEDALKCAYYRRKILSKLVTYWFGSKLKVAAAIDDRWNEESKAYQLDTEFVPGRSVALHQPFNPEQDWELRALVRGVMKPLQKLLIQSGFDGLVWQAGKGNPVALNNFLMIDSNRENYSFVWIDLESGVPALIPMNPITLFSFYLPKSFKHRDALFDNVDIKKLNQYIHTNQAELQKQLSSSDYATLLAEIEQLSYHQKKWKSMPRVLRSIQYHFKKGRITETQANWYARHPLRWYGREFKRLIGKVFHKLADVFVKIINKLRSIPYIGYAKNLIKLLFSRRYRLKIARDYVSARIHHWQDRKQLTAEDAEYLFSQLQSDFASDYLSDFGVHLGMKVFVKGTEYLLFPILYAVGLIDEIILGVVLIMGGPLSRTIYTGYRMVQASVEDKELPWVALIAGVVPMLIGNIAYPCQMVYSASGKRGKMARFIVYDTFTRLGDKFPIWGGEDTLTEHFFNHTADRILRWVDWLRRR